MGVPRLAPWIFNTFPHARNKIFLKDSESYYKGYKQIDNLYIDANGIIHSSAQEIFNYGDNKRIIEPLKNIKYSEKINMLFENFWDKILQLMKAVKPSRLLYIAIDGTAPVAKQIQQRQRRFVAARTSAPTTLVTEKWNSNCITPGTEFMDKLTQFIDSKIKELVFETKGQLGAIFSSPNDPGEGEHKIMNFIRSRKEADEVFDKYSHCIYSPDGDLIMLCMTTYLDQIYLLRNGMEPNTFDYINMSFISKNLFGSLYETRVIARNKYDVVNDFIFAGFFVGNDFLPKIQMFYTLEEGLQSMLNVCKFLSRKNKYLTKNFKIDCSSFAEFVSLIAADEIKHLTRQANIVYTEASGKEKFNDVLAQKHINSSTKKFDFDGYSTEYYESRFGGVSKQEVCFEYLKSLLWVFVYYSQKIPSWRYYYKFHYAPLMTDFAEFLTTSKARRLLSSAVEDTFELDEPCAPVVQLLSVLPSSSKYLIPEKYRHLVQDDANELNFKIDYAGKTKEYMGVAIIEPAKTDEFESKYFEICDNDFEFMNPTFYFYSPETKKVENIIIE